jgi:beta-lactamase class A
MRQDLTLTRRRLLVGLAAGIAAANFRVQAASRRDATGSVADLETEIGGRIGLAVLDTAGGRQLSHRADERYAMCSTFKLMLAAAILSRVDGGTVRLEQSVPFTRSDLLPNSPLADSHPEGGAVPLKTMLESVIEASDNTAANRLLALIGGPAGYTDYLRSIGDSTTRLDRIELDLNSNVPGDPRDTTTPNAMLQDMHRVLLGDRLAPGSRNQLLQWMRDCRTGRERLRAKLPPGWDAGDKTGTGARGAVNDLAIFRPPNRPPILAACYMSDSGAPTKTLNLAHARIGSLIASTMT